MEVWTVEEACTTRCSLKYSHGGDEEQDADGMLHEKEHCSVSVRETQVWSRPTASQPVLQHAKQQCAEGEHCVGGESEQKPSDIKDRLRITRDTSPQN